MARSWDWNVLTGRHPGRFWSGIIQRGPGAYGDGDDPSFMPGEVSALSLQNPLRKLQDHHLGD